MKKSKGLVFAIVFLIIALFATGIYTYFALSKQEVAKKIEPHTSVVTGNENDNFRFEESGNKYNNITVFPKLNKSDFYDKIRIINGVPTITDDFISSIIKYVIKNTNMTDGNIYYNEIKRTKSSFIVMFLWKAPSGEEISKTYNIDLLVDKV